MTFKERYKNNNTPWEINRPDCNIINAVKNTPIAPCKVLDIGCGTGDNVIWLQQQGFDATGIDSEEVAINRALKKVRQAEVDCQLYVLDFLNDSIPGVPYDFAFDRGCFHHFLEFDKLTPFAEKVAEILKDDGLWLSLAGSADETREVPGPPQLSARDIVNGIEPYFKIQSLIANHFDSKQEIPAKNWVCLMRKR